MVGFFRGGEFNRKYSNVLMRWRVGLQFAALAVLVILFLAYS
ncbi:HIG1 domain-containing protein [Geminicoccus flavidas]